jgi:hypothetical protein
MYIQRKPERHGGLGPRLRPTSVPASGGACCIRHCSADPGQSPPKRPSLAATSHAPSHRSTPLQWYHCLYERSATVASSQKHSARPQPLHCFGAPSQLHCRPVGCVETQHERLRLTSGNMAPVLSHRASYATCLQGSELSGTQGLASSSKNEHRPWRRQLPVAGLNPY